MLPKPVPIYAVIDYRTRAVLYRGKSLTAASSAMSPGTVWGSGDTVEDALAQATYRIARLEGGEDD